MNDITDADGGKLHDIPRSTKLGLDDTTQKRRGRFSKGRSGNPAGRPKGSRNLTTQMIEALL
jgi:hypothetical protein